MTTRTARRNGGSLRQRRSSGGRVVAMVVLCAGTVVAACDGPQSALDPASDDARRVADLFIAMATGAAVIWAGVVALALYALAGRRQHSERRVRVYVIGGGVLVPVAVLTPLLAYGLHLLPSLTDLPPEGGLRIAVSGERWWWRVHYVLLDGRMVEAANEIRLPVDERVLITLTSPDVIHSLWMPSLGGKVDMIPGRENRMVVEPSRTGTFRGACAEFCGESHALMQFVAVVMEPGDFAAWLDRQAAPARRPRTAAGARGHDLFLANGCGGCHTVRGTPADGAVGPDLTHVGSRLTLAAGILDNDAPAYAHWIANTRRIKPGVLMPAFAMLPDADLAAIAAYLDGLE